MPRLDIVIVNWNAGPLLQRCLDTVFASRCDGFELGRVVVVDNVSEDGSADHLRGPKASLVVIRNLRNRGFAVACNQGAAGSTADYLLFLNPDTELDADSLGGAVRFMQAKENAGVEVSGIRLRDAQGVTQRCCARFPTPGLMIAQALGLDRFLPALFPPHFMVEWDHQDSRDVPQVMGAFLLIRRSRFEALHGFDERFFLYYEDVDLCFRVVQAGGRCVHNAGASALHVGGGTTQRIKARRQYLGARSRIRYARKHFGRIAAMAVAAAGLVLEPVARAGLGALRGSLAEVKDAVKGGAMLWADLLSLSATPGSEGAAAADKPLRVLALTRYPRLGASSRTRFLAYLPALQGAGMEVTVSPFFTEGYLPNLYAGRRARLADVLPCYLRRIGVLLGSRAYDLLWIEKEALPWVPLWLERALIQGVPSVVDYDDAWFHRYNTPSLIRALLGRKLAGLVRRSKVTVVGNDYLGNWAREAGAADVVELPTPVSLDSYHEAAPHQAPALRVGWIGTPSSAASYLRPLVPVLAEAVAGGWLSLTIVGARSADLEGIDASFLAWSEATEVEQLHQFDVGIMPLTEDRWSLGKCAYKLIQYMAGGLPVVASPVGMNRKVVRDGVNGFLASTPEEWLASLRRLAEDAELRRRMGEAGRRIVAQEYSLSVLEPRLIALLRRAAQPPAGRLVHLSRGSEPG